MQLSRIADDDERRQTSHQCRRCTQLALPLGTRVLAGDGLLHNQRVTWATVLFGQEAIGGRPLQTNEILLVSTHERPGRVVSSDAEIIRWAADNKAAAVVVSEQPAMPAIAEANAYGIPLLLLPPGGKIRMVEKAVISLLVDQKGHLERRGTQIYKQLTLISSRNEGMSELINAIARLTNKAVVIQDKRLQILYNALQPQLVGYWDDIEAFLRKVDHLPVELQDRLRVNEIDNPVLLQSLATPGLARFVAPVITKDIGRGYLSIIGYEDTLDDLDLLVAEHGSAACALEMAKAKAISDTEKRLRGTFLERLLNGDVTPLEANRQGERFEHDMLQPHIAIVVRWQHEKSPSLRRLETIINGVVTGQRAHALVWQRERESEVLIFHAVRDDDAIQSTSKLAKAITAEIQRQYPNDAVAIGIGQMTQDILNWHISHRDAVQAVELAMRLQTDTPLYIGDLGVYQLILSLGDKDKLLSFCETTLGQLIDYDARQNADLLKTLEAFFTCHGNLSETAKLLIVHRNTLLYRMNRISEIASIDFERQETRLALHLALTIRRLLMLK